MPLPSSAKNWRRLPSRLALLLGFGALSAAGAEAALPGAAVDNASGAILGGTAARADEPGALQGSVLRMRNGTIEIAEGGGHFRELRLGDTTEARHLRRLLENNPTARSDDGVRLGPTILAGSGGEGFHWVPVPRNAQDPARPAGAADPSRAPRPASERGGSPQTPAPNADQSATKS